MSDKQELVDSPPAPTTTGQDSAGLPQPHVDPDSIPSATEGSGTEPVASDDTAPPAPPAPPESPTLIDDMAPMAPGGITTPPMEPVTPKPPQAPPPAPASGHWPAWLMVLLAVVLVAATAGITYLVTSDTVGSTTSSTDTATQTPSAPEVVPGDEPIADAAEVILPSVVQIQTQEGLGSGVIYTADGLILTAAHVVEGHDTVTVRLNDGEDVEGTVLGGTADADVALVQVDRTGLPAAQLALDSAPRVGQMAIAVGSPWGLQGTVTAGIISAINQPIGCGQGGDCRSLLQTDAAINPGNSGGALVDREGRLLGINVSIFSVSGANDGVGFAVPIAVANDIAQAVISGDDLGVAYLGVVGGNVESGRAGAEITAVTPGTGAADAGVQVGDLVVSIDGVPVQGIEDLAAQVRTHRPGSTVELVVVRDGQEMTIPVLLSDRPDDLS
jgi:S1-C subfamily serine protease